MTITPKDLMNYGYTYDGMDGLNRETALEAFDKGKAVFLLYPDNTEGLAITRDEIEKFDGLFGIEKFTNSKNHISDSHPSTLVTLMKKENGERLEQLRKHYYDLITNCDMYDGIYPYHLKDMQFPSDIVSAVEEINKSNDCYDERRQIENTTMLCKKVIKGATLEEIMSHKNDVANDIENLFALNSRHYAKPKKSKGIEMSR